MGGVEAPTACQVCQARQASQGQVWQGYQLQGPDSRFSRCPEAALMVHCIQGGFVQTCPGWQAGAQTLESWVPCVQTGHRPGSTTLRAQSLQRQVRSTTQCRDLLQCYCGVWIDAPGNSIITLYSSCDVWREQGEEAASDPRIRSLRRWCTRLDQTVPSLPHLHHLSRSNQPKYDRTTPSTRSLSGRITQL